MGHPTLYPSLEAYESGMLALDDLHTMAWDQAGSPEGVPVVYVHGGPGAPTSPDVRRLFDPDHYRIVLFHQRGTGRSTPHAELKDNTTWHLVADMEKLRQHLEIERWHICGGSWGSTLSLAYGESHPEHCISLMLRGIFLCRDHEIDWFLHGIGKFFPESERAFLEPIPKPSAVISWPPFTADCSIRIRRFTSRPLSPGPATRVPA